MARVAAVLALLLMPYAAEAAISAGCSDLGLDEALEQANAQGGGDILITCPSDTTIYLRKAKHFEQPGTYSISSVGPGLVVLDARGLSRHFMLGDTGHNKGLRADGFQLTLRKLSLRNGFATAVQTKKGTVQGGGCIYVGTLGKLYLEV